MQRNIYIYVNRQQFHFHIIWITIKLQENNVPYIYFCLSAQRFINMYQENISWKFSRKSGINVYLYSIATTITQLQGVNRISNTRDYKTIFNNILTSMVGSCMVNSIVLVDSSRSSRYVWRSPLFATYTIRSARARNESQQVLMWKILLEALRMTLLRFWRRRHYES